MNTPLQSPPRTGRRWWLWFIVPAGILALGLTALAGVLWNSVRIGSDARALRVSAHAASGIAWQREVELSVGALPLGLARVVMGFVRQAPEEARMALRAVRSVEVGVYRAQPSHGPIEAHTVLTSADKTMTARGWDRVVGVSEGREVVGIYVPRKMASARNVEVCVLVLDGDEMVVVSARGNLEAALELACNRPEWRSRWHPNDRVQETRKPFRSRLE
jgi:hypothetical protein